MAELVEELEVEKINTGIEGAEENDTFNVSTRALEMVLKVREESNLDDSHFLRIGSQSGGCSGMQYALGFDNNVNENDRDFEVGGLKIVTDAKSLFYLLGVTLDFVDGPQGSGFIFNNPNNFNTCGCHA